MALSRSVRAKSGLDAVTLTWCIAIKKKCKVRAAALTVGFPRRLRDNAEAIDIFKNKLNTESEGLVLLLDTFVDHGDYYSIAFNTKEYEQSRNPMQAIVGSGPMILNKSTGVIYKTGSTESVEYYITNIKEGGHPYAQPSGQMILANSTISSRKKICQLLKENLKITLSESMLIAKKIETSEEQINCESTEQAIKLASILSELGITVKHKWSLDPWYENY